MMVEWSKVYDQNLPIYIQLIEAHFECADLEKQSNTVELLLDKLTFKLPKGLTKKEIKEIGLFPVVSQSKDMTVGYSDAEENAISNNLPLIVYGDHSKTIKFIDFPFVIGAEGVKLLKPKKSILPKYFYYSLIGLETDTKNYGRHFSLLKKKHLTIPSSLDVQRKVVMFLEDLMANKVLDEGAYFSFSVERKIQRLQRNSLTTVQLKDELAHQRTLLKKLRQQILQEAIEGKLTADWRSQNPDIEPASELLKRIAAEKAQLVKAKKIKAQKPLPPITDEEKPFELPKGWEWCRLDQLIYESPRNGYSPTTVNFPTNIKTLRLGATTSGKFDATEIKYIDEEIEKDSFLWIKNRDILIQRANSIDFVGVSAIYHGKENCFIYPDLMMKLKPVSSISEIYLHHTLMSSFCREYFRKNATGSQKSMPKINQKVVSSALIPLCSEDEQQAIVAKVEKLLAIYDQLETQITQNQTHAEQLMQAVLKEAFNHNSESRG